MIGFALGPMVADHGDGATDRRHANRLAAITACLAAPSPQSCLINLIVDIGLEA